MAQFVTRLRQLVNLCEFGNHIDDFIRDQEIDNYQLKRLRTKLLAERDLLADGPGRRRSEHGEWVRLGRQKQPKVNDRHASHNSS